VKGKSLVYEVRNLKTASADLLLYETLFHNANGYIGIRSCFEEGYPGGFPSIRGTYINGFYDFIPMAQAEKLYGLAEEKQVMLNVADTQGIRLFFEEEEFCMWKGTVPESRRSLDMAEGYSERFVHWVSPGGKEAEIRIRRIASFARPSLFLISYSVKALNFSGPVRFVSCHKGDVENFSDPNDPRVAREALCRLKIIRAELKENASFITAGTIKSKLQVCSAVDHRLLGGSILSPAARSGGDIQTILTGNTAVCNINTDIRENESITLCKYSVFTDSIRHGDYRYQAEKELATVITTELPVLYREQKEYLDAYWDDALLEIEGDEDLQQAVQYNMFQLVQSAGKDGYGIAAKGLSGEGYEGHYFWDTEMYIEPFFILTNPLIARSLIGFRYSILEEARKNALLMGHKEGALFPWRTIMGRECSGFFPAGSAQYHINGDIAWSVVFYYLVTGDLDFIAEKVRNLFLNAPGFGLTRVIFTRGNSG
jgi:alpha,alpha-trehalose phosphorylase